MPASVGLRGRKSYRVHGPPSPSSSTVMVCIASCGGYLQGRDSLLIITTRDDVFARGIYKREPRTHGYDTASVVRQEHSADAFNPRGLVLLHTVCLTRAPVAPIQRAALWQCGLGALVPPRLIALRRRACVMSTCDYKRFCKV